MSNASSQRTLTSFTKCSESRPAAAASTRAPLAAAAPCAALAFCEGLMMIDELDDDSLAVTPKLAHNGFFILGFSVIFFN